MAIEATCHSANRPACFVAFDHVSTKLIVMYKVEKYETLDSQNCRTLNRMYQHRNCFRTCSLWFLVTEQVRGGQGLRLCNIAQVVSFSLKFLIPSILPTSNTRRVVFEQFISISLFGSSTKTREVRS